MLKNMMVTAMVLLLAGVLRAQTNADTALAGEWVLEKMVVVVQRQQTAAAVASYELRDVEKMYRLSPYVIRSIRFGDGRFHMDNGAGQVWGRFVESGVQEVRLMADTIPGAVVRPGRVENPLRYSWQRSGDNLQLHLPVSIYRDADIDAIVIGRYTCHYTRKK